MSNEAIPPERAEHETVEIILEIIELGDHAKHHHDKPAPHAKQYAFRVDKTRVVVDKPTITGREILAKVDKTSEKFKLYQHKHGHQPIQIAPDQEVNLREPGVERFTTMPRDTTEGREAPCLKQDFRMPEADEIYLNNLGLQWEARLDGQNRLILIHAWKIPSGYNVAEATLALLIPANYPDSQIDMVYFNPHLARMDGKAIANLTPFAISGIAFQQWSRHRTGANPWRAGVDDLASHLALVDDWLCREFGER
jgi:Prokaryotic E2 family E/Multiubiquitin